MIARAVFAAAITLCVLLLGITPGCRDLGPCVPVDQTAARAQPPCLWRTPEDSTWRKP